MAQPQTCPEMADKKLSGRRGFSLSDKQESVGRGAAEIHSPRGGTCHTIKIFIRAHFDKHVLFFLTFDNMHSKKVNKSIVT